MVLGGDLEDVSPSGGKLPVPEPFVMAVGAVGVRKNYGLLYQVWRELIQKHGARTPNLALVGGVGFLTGDLLYQLQRDPVVQGKIHQVGGIDDGLLRELYSRCLFTVYPSIYEGSGTPVVESLAAGKACVASSSSSVPEMGGELAEYHHPQDFKRCLELVERLWLDEAYRRKREEEIRRKFRATSWREASRIYVGFLRAHLERAREDARAGEPAMRLSALGGKP
jgi:glycosyltransferase involved in cell wall biosynthesis